METIHSLESFHIHQSRHHHHNHHSCPIQMIGTDSRTLLTNSRDGSCCSGSEEFMKLDPATLKALDTSSPVQKNVTKDENNLTDCHMMIVNRNFLNTQSNTSCNLYPFSVDDKSGQSANLHDTKLTESEIDKNFDSHPTPDDDDPNVTMCICPVCGYSASSPRGQDEHMEVVHGDANASPNSHLKSETSNDPLSIERNDQLANQEMNSHNVDKSWFSNSIQTETLDMKNSFNTDSLWQFNNLIQSNLLNSKMANTQFPLAFNKHHQLINHMINMNFYNSSYDSSKLKSDDASLVDCGLVKDLSLTNAKSKMNHTKQSLDLGGDSMMADSMYADGRKAKTHLHRKCTNEINGAFRKKDREEVCQYHDQSETPDGLNQSGSLLPAKRVDSRRRYRCNICPATFPWHGDLAAHLRVVHGVEKSRENSRHGKAGNFCCTHCKYVAKYQSELKRHMRLHLGVKPFVCVFCPYRSAWKGDLKRHMESHHRERFSSETDLIKIMSQFKNNAGTNVSQYHSDFDHQHYHAFDKNKQRINSRNSNTPLSDDEMSCVDIPSMEKANIEMKDNSALNDNHLSTNRGYLNQVNAKSKADIDIEDNCDHIVDEDEDHELNDNFAINDVSSITPTLNMSNLNVVQTNCSTNHLLSHVNLKHFKCPLCIQRSNYKSDIRKHMRNEHPDQGHLPITILNKSQCDQHEPNHESKWLSNPIKGNMSHLSMSPNSESSSLSLDLDLNPNRSSNFDQDGVVVGTAKLTNSADSKMDLDSYGDEAMPIDLSKKGFDGQEGDKGILKTNFFTHFTELSDKTKREIDELTVNSNNVNTDNITTVNSVGGFAANINVQHTTTSSLEWKKNADHHDHVLHSAVTGLDLANKGAVSLISQNILNPNLIVNPTLLNPALFMNSTLNGTNAVSYPMESFLSNMVTTSCAPQLETEEVINLSNSKSPTENIYTKINSTTWNETYSTEQHPIQGAQSAPTINLLLNIQQHLMMNGLLQSWHQNQIQSNPNVQNQFNSLTFPLTTSPSILAGLTSSLAVTTQTFPTYSNQMNFPKLHHASTLGQSSAALDQSLCALKPSLNQIPHAHGHSMTLDKIDLVKEKNDSSEKAKISHLQPLGKQRNLDGRFKKERKQNGCGIVSSNNSSDLASLTGSTKEEQWKRHQCSGCGHRSNWKWDINKHIKVAHPERTNISTLTLDLEEAKRTYSDYMSRMKLSRNRYFNEANNYSLPNNTIGWTSDGFDTTNRPYGFVGEGYYRPYKCSVCGHRSNWKWDVRKHIKQIHYGEAEVITLSLEEARLTIHQYKNRRRYHSRQFQLPLSLNNPTITPSNYLVKNETTPTWNSTTIMNSTQTVAMNVSDATKDNNALSTSEHLTHLSYMNTNPLGNSDNANVGLTHNLVNEKIAENQVTLSLEDHHDYLYHHFNVTTSTNTCDELKSKQNEFYFKNRKSNFKKYKCKFCAKQFQCWKSRFSHLKFKHFSEIKRCGKSNYNVQEDENMRNQTDHNIITGSENTNNQFDNNKTPNFLIRNQLKCDKLLMRAQLKKENQAIPLTDQINMQTMDQSFTLNNSYDDFELTNHKSDTLNEDILVTQLGGLLDNIINLLNQTSPTSKGPDYSNFELVKINEHFKENPHLSLSTEDKQGIMMKLSDMIHKSVNVTANQCIFPPNQLNSSASSNEENQSLLMDSNTTNQEIESTLPKTILSHPNIEQRFLDLAFVLRQISSNKSQTK